MRARTEQAVREGRRTALLYDLNAALSGEVTLDAILDRIAERVVHVYGAEGCRIVLPDDDGELVVRARFPATLPAAVDRRHLALASWAMAYRTPAGEGTAGRRVVLPHGVDRPAAPTVARRGPDTLFLPIATTERVVGASASGVDERLERYMREQDIDETWEATQRVVVVLDGLPAAGTVVRNAWRLASALRGELVAVAVAPPGGLATLPAAERAAVERNLRLAEDLGATIRVAEGARLAETLAAVAREEHATVVVLGGARAGRWGRMFRTSLADQLLDRLDGVDVHVIGPTGDGG